MKYQVIKDSFYIKINGWFEAFMIKSDWISMGEKMEVFCSRMKLTMNQMGKHKNEIIEGFHIVLGFENNNLLTVWPTDPEFGEYFERVD